MRRVSWASTRSASISRGSATARAMAAGVISWNTIRRTGTVGFKVCCQVPGDRLALAVLIGGEVDLVGVLDQAP